MKLLGYVLLALSATVTTAFGEELEIARFDVLGPESFNMSETGEGSRLTFAASGAIWTLDLAPNARLARQLPANSPTQIFRGKMAGNANSWVRLSERNGVFQGLIFDGQEYHALEQSPSNSGTDQLRFYALKDAIIAPGSLGCGVVEDTNAGFISLQAQAEAVTDELVKEAAAAASQSIDVIVVGDSQFQTENPTDPTGALMDRLNIVDGYFSDQVGVTLNVIEFRLTDAATEPFTTNDAGDLLDEVSDYKNSEAASRNAGLLHLYTGRNLDGSTAGIAFRGALCSSRFGTALSEGRRNLATDSLIAAHEFGHNFGSPHDGDSNGACGATPENFLMAPAINGSSTFSACSLQEIQQDVAAAACVTAIEPIDVLPILNNFPNSVSINDSFTGRVQVTNNGSAQASNIVLDVAVPASVDLDQTTLPANCAASGSGAQCNIASLSAGNNVDFQFGFSATASGNSTISATTTTPSDDNTANDMGERIVIVNAVVDLSGTLTTDANFVVGETETLSIGIQNNSVDASGSATVQFNASTFLQIESADAGCSIAGTVVTCQTNDVPANASQSFSISVSGAQAGSTIISATSGGSASDPDASNDREQVSITVTDAVNSTDLAVSLSGPADIDLNQAGSYVVSVNNNSNEIAEASSLTISLPAELRADSADNGCTIAANVTTCVFGNIAGSGQETVNLDVTAVSAGSGTVSASATTTSSDSNAANDSDSLAVTVTDPNAPSTDLAASVSGPASITRDQTAQFTATLNNASTDTAEASMLTISVPAILRADSVDNASCSIAGGSVTCNFGDIAGAAQRTANITVTAVSAGSGSVTATAATTTNDTNAANNSASAATTVTNPPPATTDLSVSLAGAASVTRDASTDFTITVSNTSTVPAAGSTVLVSLPATLRGDSADNSNCSVTATELNCDFGTLAGSADVSVVLTTTALSAGSGSLNASVNTATSDSDSSNDSDSVSVTVNDPAPTPPTPSSGGGGGSTGALSLLGLALFAWRRRRVALY